MNKTNKEFTEKDLWNLLKQDHQKYNSQAHQEDRMSLNEFSEELVGTNFHGYNVKFNDDFRNVFFVKANESK